MPAPRIFKYGIQTYYDWVGRDNPAHANLKEEFSRTDWSNYVTGNGREVARLSKLADFARPLQALEIEFPPGGPVTVDDLILWPYSIGRLFQRVYQRFGPLSDVASTMQVLLPLLDAGMKWICAPTVEWPHFSADPYQGPDGTKLFLKDAFQSFRMVKFHPLRTEWLTSTKWSPHDASRKCAYATDLIIEAEGKQYINRGVITLAFTEQMKVKQFQVIHQTLDGP